MGSSHLMNPNQRRRLLSDWLGFPLSKTPPKPADLKEAFQKAFHKMGLSDRLKESTLNDAWQDIVGPALSPHCRPGTIRQGKLTVFVDHSTWLHQLSFIHKRDVLASIQLRFPHLKVKDLLFRLGR